MRSSVIRRYSLATLASLSTSLVCGFHFSGPSDVVADLPLLAIMRESLRLNPTAPVRVVVAHEDTTLGGKYFIPKGAKILVNTDSAQRDPKVYGEDVRTASAVWRSRTHSLSFAVKRVPPRTYAGWQVRETPCKSTRSSLDWPLTRNTAKCMATIRIWPSCLHRQCVSR